MLLSALAFSACKSIKPLEHPKYDQFIKSNKTPQSVLPDTVLPFAALSGKAKVQFYGKNINERANATFKANKKHSLIKLSNSLGIEGLHLLISPDSVTEYNRVDEQVTKTSVTNYQEATNTIKIPLHLYQLFFPWRTIDWEFTFENDDYLQLRSPGSVLYLQKETGHVTEYMQWKKKESIRIKALYDGYSLIDGYPVPRKIQVFVYDDNETDNQPERLYILIQKIQSTENTAVSLSYPDSIPYLEW